MRKSTQLVPHSYSEDGQLRFGETIVIGHPQLQGSLCCDLWEEVAAGTGEFEVSLTTEHQAQARNTFIITRVGKEKLRDMSSTQYEADNILHFGEPFHLACNESLLVDERTDLLNPPLYVASTLKSSTRVTRASNRQMVYMSPTCTNDAVWVCQPMAGQQDRLLSAGLPVPANSPVVIQHRGTGQRLCSEAKYSSRGDFGVEYEVSCFTKQTPHKQMALLAETEGRKTGQTLDRVENEENHWLIITSADPELARDNRNLPKPATAEVLIKKVLDIIRARGEGSVRGLRRSFRIMDDGRDQQLDREDLKWGLKDYGVHLDDNQFDTIFDYFDRSGDGLVSIKEFLVAIRGEMNQRRLDLAMLAYGQLDKNGDGTVTRADVASAYDVSQHPRVISGELTPDEAIDIFMSQWETQEADGVITPKEWEEYYQDISAEIDDDDYFELMIRNAWHISGGEGWCENSANLRVLVTYSDGSQEVVEVKDDLGVDKNDTADIIRRLEAQGVQNIVGVSVAD
uniref:EF-hand domain-containing protein n=1 Tax=Fibrocapsa japonica TaxID=94617 RepID=A0A7S2XX41_9STRA